MLDAREDPKEVKDSSFHRKPTIYLGEIIIYICKQIYNTKQYN